MQINKAVFKNANGIPVLTVNGTCVVGHKRRMNEVEVEGPVVFGELVEVEAKKNRWFYQHWEENMYKKDCKHRKVCYCRRVLSNW